MRWTVAFDGDFDKEIEGFPEAVEEEITALSALLEKFGPQLRRPHCATLSGSRHANMKELRFSLPDAEWRVAFAFDPERQAILLVGGSKSGISQKRFYRDLIRIADSRFDKHLASLKGPKGI